MNSLIMTLLQDTCSQTSCNRVVYLLCGRKCCRTRVVKHRVTELSICCVGGNQVFAIFNIGRCWQNRRYASKVSQNNLRCSKRIFYAVDPLTYSRNRVTVSRSLHLQAVTSCFLKRWYPPTGLQGVKILKNSEHWPPWKKSQCWIEQTLHREYRDSAAPADAAT
jgi:hypothetical protein